MLYNQPSAFWWCDLYLVLARPIATVPQLRHTHYEHIKCAFVPRICTATQRTTVFSSEIHTLDGQCMKILGCTQYSVPFRIAPRKGECVSKECLALSKVLPEDLEHHISEQFLFPSVFPSDIHALDGQFMARHTCVWGRYLLFYKMCFIR